MNLWYHYLHADLTCKTLNLQPAYCLHADLTEFLHSSAMDTCEHSLLWHYTSMATRAASAAGMQQPPCRLTVKFECDVVAET